jgi:hypothetical protein
MSKARKGKSNAFDANSTDDVGLGTDQPGYQVVACNKVWGGNYVADEVVKLPGLVALIHSVLLRVSTIRVSSCCSGPMGASRKQVLVLV